MTFVEKYPHSVEAILQTEAKNIVNRVHALYHLDPYTQVSVKVMINPELWNHLNAKQKDYFTSLFGGTFYITELKDRDGFWLCVSCFDILSFHYHAPLRVHPIRVYK